MPILDGVFSNTGCCVFFPWKCFSLNNTSIFPSLDNPPPPAPRGPNGTFHTHLVPLGLAGGVLLLLSRNHIAPQNYLCGVCRYFSVLTKPLFSCRACPAAGDPPPYDGPPSRPLRPASHAEPLLGLWAPGLDSKVSKVQEKAEGAGGTLGRRMSLRPSYRASTPSISAY